MDEHLEEMRIIIQLSDGISEGLQHLLSNLKAVELNPPFYLLTDAIEGFLSISESLKNFQDQLPENKIKETAAELEKELAAAVLALEANDFNSFSQLLESYIVPACFKWRSALIGCLNQYVLC